MTLQEKARNMLLNTDTKIQIRCGTAFETKDIENLSTLIIDPNGKGLNDHWQKSSFTLLNGLIALIIYKCQQDDAPPTISMIEALISSPNHNINELWLEMINAEPQATLAIIAGQTMIDKGEREAASILSSVKQYLDLI
ncbi:hypothetical protein TUM4438_45660 [Shewanella sairae]|uniref:Uncharacterized protein n=1 Tax=Shewanella sairae TaxID=190310 RepID=A0ABQ4PRV1_9GAMM|nr:type IV secretory system conjugative DNA transfer family protein [Shewanella sairae]MCL1132645.1 type IV secretory system conjugative DNA transfer family protein [Shewanella sairae]GIU52586.1 hypothetical protein TUM4438_45660 [Shewanella sairae]